MSIDPASRSFNCGPERSARWPTVRVRTPSWPARLISVEYPACENSAPALPAARLTVSRSPRRTMTSVRSGESADRSEIASRWPWPFMRAISIRAWSSITGDRRSSGPAIDISSSRASCPTSLRGRIGEDRQPLGQIRARGEFGVRNEIDQKAVEQIDVIGPKMRRPLQEQFADPPRGLGTAFGIAISDDLIEPGNQRGGDCHQTHSNPAYRRVPGNLGGLREGRVRFETAPEGAQNRGFRGLAGLAGSRQNRYISAQLMVLIRSRIESGPLPDPLFFIT